MKSFETVTQSESQEEFDPYLKDLWEEYHFTGNPPKAGSLAEKRLQEKCFEYAEYVTGLMSKYQTGSAQLRGSDAYNYSEKKRQIHNEIAIMVVGQQRSGMDTDLAENIANFAIDYAQGYKVDTPEDRDRFKE